MATPKARPARPPVDSLTLFGSFAFLIRIRRFTKTRCFHSFLCGVAEELDISTLESIIFIDRQVFNLRLCVCHAFLSAQFESRLEKDLFKRDGLGRRFYGIASPRKKAAFASVKACGILTITETVFPLPTMRSDSSRAPSAAT